MDTRAVILIQNRRETDKGCVLGGKARSEPQKTHNSPTGKTGRNGKSPGDSVNGTDKSQFESIYVHKTRMLQMFAALRYSLGEPVAGFSKRIREFQQSYKTLGITMTDEEMLEKLTRELEAAHFPDILSRVDMYQDRGLTYTEIVGKLQDWQHTQAIRKQTTEKDDTLAK